MSYFKFKVDTEKLRKSIAEECDEWEEDGFCSYDVAGDVSLTKEEYDANIEIMLDHLKRMTTPEYKAWAIENAPRKKDGTFYKGRIVERVGSDNCVFFQEWHNTWVYDALTVKAISDKELELTLDRVTDTPG